MTKVVSFCFDDGFRRSALAIAELFSQRGLAATFAVLSRPADALDPYLQGADLADWAFWRDMVARGHEVAPHGLMHERFEDLSLAEGQRTVLAALAIMERELPGFSRRKSLFHVAYMTAPAALVEWLGTQCLGIRLERGARGFNRWADLRAGSCVDAMCFGPDDVAAALATQIDEFAAQEDGWLVLVLHGVDGEGWGSLERQALAQLLDRMLALGMAIEPANRVMQRCTFAHAQR